MKAEREGRTSKDTLRRKEKEERTNLGGDIGRGGRCLRGGRRWDHVTVAVHPLLLPFRRGYSEVTHCAQVRELGEAH